jgi:arsenate reductase
MNEQSYETLANRIKLLAHPERLRILDVLRRETECVCHLEALLDKPQPYVSQQLGALRRAGIIQDEKHGHNVYYRLIDNEVMAWLERILGPAQGEHPEMIAHKKLISCDCPKCAEQADRVQPLTDRTLATTTGLKTVLVLCTGNSCRSQMAEGLINARLEGFEAYSAGTKPGRQIHPKALEVMNEVGVDLSLYETKGLDYFQGQRFDYVITVCNSARESCPVWLGEAGERIHIGFDDPAAATGADEEITAEFRRVRDEIEEQVLGFLSSQNHS